MPTLSAAVLHRPVTVDEAATLLQEVPGARALAGGTWIMRGPIRQEDPAPAYVALSDIPELLNLETTADELSIGAAVTHQRLARELPVDADLAGLRAAAANSANPAVRNMATVGGNLSTADFPAADLVPALLALDARVVLALPAARTELRLAEYLDLRTKDTFPGLLTHVLVQRRGGASAHARLPLRAAGDYPVAIVSIHADLDRQAVPKSLRIALGSVGQVAQRWSACEDALKGKGLTGALAEESARTLAGQLEARDGVDAPGWYRREVLPALLRRAIESLPAT